MRWFRLFLFLIALYNLSSCHGDRAIHYPSQLEQSGILGPVTRLAAQVYVADSSQAGWRLVEKSVELFNETGNTPSDTMVDVNTGDVFVDVLTYNKNQAVLSNSTWKNETLLSTVAFRYDAQGSMHRLDIFTGDSLSGYYEVTELSSKGDLQSGKQYSPTGIFLGSFHYDYDGFAPINRTFKNDSGQVFEAVRYRLNEHKWPLQEILTTTSGKSTVSDTTEYAYEGLDRYGNWRESIMLRKNAPFKKTVRQISYR